MRALAATVLAFAVACAPSRPSAPAPRSSLAVLSGDGQVGPIGAWLPLPLRVQLAPPDVGVPVRWSWYDRGQPVLVTLTDSRGIASVVETPFARGPATVTASLEAEPAIAVTFTVTGG